MLYVTQKAGRQRRCPKLKTQALEENTENLNERAI